MRKLYALFIFTLCTLSLLAQGSPDYTGGLKVALNEDGSKYFRLITWHQMWATANEASGGGQQITPLLRRSRMLMFAQINNRFLILTHIGLNNLGVDNMDPVGRGPGAQVFMHDAWVEYAVIQQKLHIGGGLHYWNGISRLTNQSTLNILTLDAPRFNWANLGITDMFARHLGIYAKGKLGKLDYRVSLSDALVNGLDANLPVRDNQAVYRGRELLGKQEAGRVVQGYFQYEFLDQESNLLPYAVGSYLGSKEVFNIGVGFLQHSNGTLSLAADSSLIGHNVLLLGVDVFYDKPLNKGACLTAYASFYQFDYGPNYLLSGNSDLIGTGNIVYGQVGYVVPDFSEAGRLQPYVAYSNRNFDALDGAVNQLGIGANWYISGHNAKLTVEYNTNQVPNADPVNNLRLQAMIYL